MSRRCSARGSIPEGDRKLVRQINEASRIELKLGQRIRPEWPNTRVYRHRYSE